MVNVQFDRIEIQSDFDKIATTKLTKWILKEMKLCLSILKAQMQIWEVLAGQQFKFQLQIFFHVL